MRHFLFGTDWYMDCDDVVALRILARAHKKGQIRLCGIAINACNAYSVASVDGFLQTEGIAARIPLGIDRNATLPQGCDPTYQKRLAPLCKHYHSNDDAIDAVRLYRTILAESTEPVEIVEVGFLQILAGLLQSEGDDISEKSGLELVKEKVKRIWSMGGKWDVDRGSEYNFNAVPFAKAASSYLCDACPVPIVFLGFEVGERILCGGNLPENDVVRMALIDYGISGGRSSWDPLTALLALEGDVEAAGYYGVRGTATVDPQSGKNRFVPGMQGLHTYVIKRHPDSFYEQKLFDAIS